MKGYLRKIAFFCALCVLIAGLPAHPASAYNPATVDQLITYENTGNQRQDIIGVALTQVGYMEKPVNDTLYGDWYCLPEQEWCAMFVSWCARQAEVSTDIIETTAWAHPNSFGVPYYEGTEYTPQPGDLFFTEDFTHTGIVWYVEGDFFYCIEGNARYHDYTVPPDPTIDSYHVMTNKRLISAHSFGVPNYRGCQPGHSYVRGHDSAHPHRSYYQCSICGDRYYTGYTDCVANCPSCFSCGCDSRYAGYYEVLPNTEFLHLNKGHGSANMANYVTVGSVVYVYGIHKASGWAYIDYYGLRGHIPASYLKAYPNAPAAPTPTIEKTDWLTNEDISLRWQGVANAEQYRLQLYRDGTLYRQLQPGISLSCQLGALPKGSYEARLTACNRAGQSPAGSLQFQVRDTYVLTYDSRGGTDIPESQHQLLGQAQTISLAEPSLAGKTFLGWTSNQEGSYVQYLPGQQLSADRDITLYAVWKDDAALPESLVIKSPPVRLYYLPGDPLDCTGLTLSLTYSDGSGLDITDGYTVSGFDSDELGQKLLTFTYQQLQCTHTVQVVAQIPGDITGDRFVNRDDVMALLWHINFPELYPVTAYADFTQDDRVDRDDVMALLWHINFPALYPIEIPETQPEGDPL